MNLNTLRTLTVVAEIGSFVDAAQRLNMTLSAVSMQMKTLETLLDADLFDRGFRPPQLTPLGRRVARHARTVLAAYDDLVGLCQSPDTIKGDFRIGFVPTSSVRLLPGFLARARERFPLAHFTVETSLSDDLLARLKVGMLDAAVVTGGDDVPRTMRTYPVSHEALVFCLPPHAAHWSIEDCMARISFIHFMPHTGIGRLIAQQLDRMAATPSDVIVLDRVDAVAECVRAGVGFSILPEPDIERFAKGEIVLRPMTPKPVTRDLVLAWPGGSRVDAHAALLATALEPGA
ncbi:MAG: LysR family transcriptional regulator [Pseudomonadota bacterium]